MQPLKHGKSRVILWETKMGLKPCALNSQGHDGKELLTAIANPVMLVKIRVQARPRHSGLPNLEVASFIPKHPLTLLSDGLLIQFPHLPCVNRQL